MRMSERCQGCRIVCKSKTLHRQGLRNVYVNRKLEPMCRDTTSTLMSLTPIRKERNFLIWMPHFERHVSLRVRCSRHQSNRDEMTYHSCSSLLMKGAAC